MRTRVHNTKTVVDLALAAALLLSAVWAITPRLGSAEPTASAPESRTANACQSADPLRVGAIPEFVEVVRGTAAPQVSAASVAVIDAASGRVMYGRHMHERRAPASTTKIMTALLAVEAIADQNGVVVSSTDASSMIGSSVMGLWPQAQVSLRDLLFGLMLPSGNDAAVELARNLALSEADFVRVMNERAKIMRMRNTSFVNPHGLDDGNHYSSAYDMAVLARFAMQNDAFREIAAAQEHYLSSPFDYSVYNGNSLLGTYPGAEGVKIGWTEAAGWTFVAAARRDERDVIVSLMNSADRDADAAALLDWAFSSPHWQGAVWSPPRIPNLFDRQRMSPLVALAAPCGGAPTARR